MIQRVTYIGFVVCAIVALPLLSEAQGATKNSILNVAGKTVAEIEGKFGKSRPESKSSLSKRIFTVSGFRDFTASLPWIEGLTEEAVGAAVPEMFVFSLKDRRATWQKFFAALGIPTSSVKWTKLGKSAQVASGVKGMPSGWEIVYTLYPEERNLVIRKRKG
ncbi:MAG: hypothetical protein IT363_08580 [Methanoregulaceae archaeon]|nr:hypothetical protein [Methanoregulaceae archaeon]